MNRSQCLFLCSALIGLVAACGSAPANVGGANPDSGSTTGNDSAVATMDADAGEQTDADAGGVMCSAPPPPSPVVPDQLGCYVNMGSGWVSVPCLCDLWLENTTPGPITAGIQLTVTPPTQVPTLTGTLDVEVAFDDPDASWYATWTKQAGNGEAFTVTQAAGTTTVTMGQGSVLLMPVPLAACETRKAVAHVSASNSSATLSMQAVLDDGVALTNATCFNPPAPL